MTLAPRGEPEVGKDGRRSMLVDAFPLLTREISILRVIRGAVSIRSRLTHGFCLRRKRREHQHQHPHTYPTRVKPTNLSNGKVNERNNQKTMSFSNMHPQNGFSSPGARTPPASRENQRGKKQQQRVPVGGNTSLARKAAAIAAQARLPKLPWSQRLATWT